MSRDQCNKNTFVRGTLVMELAGNATSEEMEAWCAQIRDRSGQPVDWYTSCGGDFIRTTGDVAKVKTTVLDLYPQLLNTVLTRKGHVKEWDLPYVLPYIMRV